MEMLLAGPGTCSAWICRSYGCRRGAAQALRRQSLRFSKTSRQCLLRMLLPSLMQVCARNSAQL
jgi:hypothetical protein